MALKAFGSGRIFGATHGAAPFRVLALPGWMHTVSDWDAVLQTLAKAGIGGVALDLPGFGGATPEPEVPTGSSGYAEVVATVLDELACPVVVAGHSFGGRVALQLAAARPDAVAALVLSGVPKLVATEGPVKKPALGFRLARSLHRRGILPNSKMEQLRRRSGSADYRNAPSATMRNVLVAVANETYEAQLGAVKCPVELVWGELDTAAPLEMAKRAADVAGANATLTVLPGIDHYTPTRSPDALAGAIRKHVLGP